MLIDARKHPPKLQWEDAMTDAKVTIERETIQRAIDALELESTTPGLETTNAAIAALRAALAQQAERQEPVAWEGSEKWESLAWELCADENGEEACNELVWEGGPIPEPWGDRWLKYEDQAKRMIALVRKHVAAPPAPAAVLPGYVLVPIDELAKLKERADFNVVEFAHAQRENPGPFVGLAGTPNAMIAAAGDKP